MKERLFGGIDLAARLAALQDRSVNYAEVDAPRPGHRGNWHVDRHQAALATEQPGPPVPGGAWHVACGLVREYEFADPHIIRAVYRADDSLMGRDMLLEGRFLGLRFYMGVRVTEVVDEDRDGERVWGWGYQTLEGHLEQGKLRYEVTKAYQTGEIGLRLRAYSRPGPITNPVVRLGFALFGRQVQLRFYHAVCQRLRDSVQAILRGDPAPQPVRTAGGLVVAPSGARPHPLGRLSIHTHHPGVKANP